MKGKAVLHNPDGVAGGKVDQITGMGIVGLIRLLVLNGVTVGQSLLRIR